MVKEMRLARRGHMIRDLETRHAHKDGHIVTMAWSGVWSEPEQRHFFIGRDMTERKLADEALKQALARQEAVFNSAIVGILTVNDNGSVETLNPAAQQLFGCADRALAQLDVGRLIDLAGPHHLGSGEQLREMLKSGPRVHELTGRRNDGSSFPLDFLLTEMPIGERRLFLVFVRDITERKRNERLKDEFVATVSHELRTPLASIAGALSLLAGGAAGQIPDAARRLLTIAHANSQRLVRLINDILDIERLEAGKMELDLRPVDVKPLVEQAIEANAGFSDGFHVRVRLEAGANEAVVRADADRLMQVLVNLLSNAVKFSPPGEEVVVSIEERDGPVRIAVRDRGAGIPDDFKDRIFEKFAQADATDTRQRGGTGLGLSIVKQIAIQLGGDIGFEAAPGGGTSFHIDLPRWHGTVAADTFQPDRQLPAA
jgi:PAS domain S-box-containing protein